MTPGAITDSGTRFMLDTRLFLSGCVLAVTLPVSAGEPITMTLTPAATAAPAYLTVRTTIESDSQNRAIEVVVQSPDYYTSSQIQLDGARAPRTTMFSFSRLPGGTYEVTAVLMGSQGKRAAATGWFRAMSSPGE